MRATCGGAGAWARGLGVVLSVWGAGCAVDEIARPGRVVPAEALRDRGAGAANVVAAVTDLGGGAGSSATAINNAGRSAGRGGLGGGFLFSPLERITSSGGIGVSNVSAINAAGMVAGTTTSPSAGGDQAYRLIPGNAIDLLPFLPSSFSESRAADVNDAGQVVGYSSWGAGLYHAAYWPDAGSAVDLGTLGGSISEATALNGNGLVVGASRTSGPGVGGPYHAFRYSLPGGPMTDLGTLPGAGALYSFARGVSEGDAIVGMSLDSLGVEQAVMWIGAAILDLGPACDALAGAHVASLASDVVGTPGSRLVVVGRCNAQPAVWYGTDLAGFTAAYLPVLAGDATGAAEDINTQLQAVGYSISSPPVFRAVQWQITLPNQPPVLLNVPGAASGAEGSPVAFAALASDPDNDPVTYTWDFGDGSPAGSGATPSHSYADNGSYTVTVTVSDGSSSTSASTTATIANVAPSGAITAPAGSSAPQGTVTLTLGNLVEPSPVDAATLQYRFNCGSGFGPIVSTASTTCALPTTGSRTLRIAVRDKDGGQATYTRTVTINNVGPSVTILSPATVTIGVGTALTISASFTDPGTADNPWTARVNWGAKQGVTSVGSVTPGLPFGSSRVYPTAGTYTALVEVKDKFGAFANRGRITVVVQ